MFLKNNLSKTHPICAFSKASKTNTTTDESIFINATLENKKTGSFVGPITFGEIAYQLLNQTIVYLEVKDY